MAFMVLHQLSAGFS
jgi:hypothetical protein